MAQRVTVWYNLGRKLLKNLFRSCIQRINPHCDVLCWHQLIFQWIKGAASQLAGRKIMASMSPSERRLQKELMSLMKEPPPGVTVDAEGAGQNLTQWIINMEGAQGTLYEGEQFQLQFKFSPKYPFDSPEVTFIGPNIPVHPHVYSNGHICLSILTEDWSPALSVQSVCLSIVSMLSSCKEKKRPPDNSFYVKTCNKNPKKTKWWYHDDSV